MNNNLYQKSLSLLSKVDKEFYLIAIGMIYITIFFSSFVMGYKTVEFHGHLLCASVFVFPLLFPINDSLAELLGSKTAYLMIIATIICEFMFSYLTFILASMPSPSHWKNQEIYPLLTSGFIHIAIADSLALALGFFANTYFIGKWGVKLFGRGFFIRSLGATAVGELLFTVSTNLIAFNILGSATLTDTFNIIFSDYIFKMAYSFVICVPNAYIVFKIKQLMNKTDDAGQNLGDNILDISKLKLRYRT